MLTKDIRQKQPGWEIWKDGYVPVPPLPHLPTVQSSSGEMYADLLADLTDVLTERRQGRAHRKCQTESTE